MKRETLTRVITGAVLLAALGVAVAQNKGWNLADLNPARVARALQPKAQSPEDAIYAMLDAAKSGDAESYLACYSGHMRELLSQSAKEASPDGFRKYLQTSNASIQGVALSNPEQLDPSQVKVRVEYVYRDRNEVQFVYLRSESGKWKIYQVDGAEHIKTLLPYGSAVTD